jgi:hypothetical protein
MRRVSILFLLVCECSLMSLFAQPAEATEVAPDVLSTGRDLSLVLTANGQIAFFSRLGEDMDWDLYSAHRSKGGWSDPKKLAFSSPHMDADPFLSPNGQRLYFMSARPLAMGEDPPEYPDIWYVNRKGDQWSSPELASDISLPEYGEGFSSIASDGTIYFSTDRPNPGWEHDIFVATWNGSGFEQPAPLPVKLKTTFSNPFIAPDKEYLIVESDAYGAEDEADLFILFRTDDGWSTPIDLGPAVNTDQVEGTPFVTSDGKHLFFCRMHPSRDRFESRIYQIAFEPLLRRARETLEKRAK